MYSFDTAWCVPYQIFKMLMEFGSHSHDFFFLSGRFCNFYHTIYTYIIFFT